MGTNLVDGPELDKPIRSSSCQQVSPLVCRQPCHSQAMAPSYLLHVLACTMVLQFLILITFAIMEPHMRYSTAPLIIIKGHQKIPWPAIHLRWAHGGKVLQVRHDM